MLKIPFDPKVSANQSFSVTLGGNVLNVDMVWNSASGGWHMSVSDGKRFIRNVPVVNNYPLFSQYRAYGIMTGDIIVVPTSVNADESYTDYAGLGSDYGLYWLNDDELKEWRTKHGMG